MSFAVQILGCQGPFPSAGGACSGFLVVSQNTKLLVDCGAGTAAEAASFGYDELDAIVLTHWHADHSSDLFVIGYARSEVLDVYAPPEPEIEVTRALTCPAFMLNRYHAEDAITVGDMTIRISRMEHPYASHAIRITHGALSVVFTGDTRYVDKLVPFCSEADLVIANAPLLKKQLSEKSAQLSAAQAAQIAYDSYAKRLLLSHLNPYTDQERLLLEAQEIYPTARLARKGQGIILEQ